MSSGGGLGLKCKSIFLENREMIEEPKRKDYHQQKQFYLHNQLVPQHECSSVSVEPPKDRGVGHVDHRGQCSVLLLQQEGQGLEIGFWKFGRWRTWLFPRFRWGWWKHPAVYQVTKPGETNVGNWFAGDQISFSGFIYFTF